MKRGLDEPSEVAPYLPRARRTSAQQGPRPATGSERRETTATSSRRPRRPLGLGAAQRRASSRPRARLRCPLPQVTCGRARRARSRTALAPPLPRLLIWGRSAPQRPASGTAGTGGGGAPKALGLALRCRPLPAGAAVPSLPAREASF